MGMINDMNHVGINRKNALAGPINAVSMGYESSPFNIKGVAIALASLVDLARKGHQMNAQAAIRNK